MRRALYFTLIFACLGFVIIGCQGIGAPATKPTVIIASPPSGSVYTVAEEVVVQSTSTDPAGITQVALLVDGAVVRQDPSPVTQGQSQFSLIQSWIAATAGQHTLTVRATNAQGATSESGIIINVREQSSVQPTTISSIATAVPLATVAPLPTADPLSPTQIPTKAGVPVDITATPVSPTNVPACTDNAKFVADLTIPDGTIFAPNAVFNKNWRVLNNGSCSWENYSLIFVSGTQMAAGGIYPVPLTQPGATADLVVPMTAPANYGKYTSTWRLRNANGQIFGTNLTVVINVPSPATAVPPTNTPPPTIAGCSGKPSDFTFLIGGADAVSINPGQSVTLSWTAVGNASAVYLSGGDFGPELGQGIETPGKRTTAPGATTVYKITALCSNSGQTRVKTVQVTVNAAVGNFAGDWVHNFGTMSLTQSGTTVTGTYQNEFDGGNGVIAGIVTGNLLEGTYTKEQTKPIQFTLSADGKRFTGSWDNANSWCGARPGQNFPNGCSFAGNWKTNYADASPTCSMSLTRHDNIITGNYCNGTVVGTVTYQAGQPVLSGNWDTGSATGTFKFFLFGYNALQFNGSWNDAFQWCGWRNSSAQPAPCKKP